MFVLQVSFSFLQLVSVLSRSRGCHNEYFVSFTTASADNFLYASRAFSLKEVQDKKTFRDVLITKYVRKWRQVGTNKKPNDYAGIKNVTTRRGLPRDSHSSGEIAREKHSESCWPQPQPLVQDFF